MYFSTILDIFDDFLVILERNEKEQIAQIELKRLI